MYKIMVKKNYIKTIYDYYLRKAVLCEPIRLQEIGCPDIDMSRTVDPQQMTQKHLNSLYPVQVWNTW